MAIKENPCGPNSAPGRQPRRAFLILNQTLCISPVSEERRDVHVFTLGSRPCMPPPGCGRESRIEVSVEHRFAVKTSPRRSFLGLLRPRGRRNRSPSSLGRPGPGRLGGLPGRLRNRDSRQLIVLVRSGIKIPDANASHPCIQSHLTVATEVAVSYVSLGHTASTFRSAVGSGANQPSS